MIELTYERVNELLDEAIAEKGADYVYKDEMGRVAGIDTETCCQYVHGEGDSKAPGCIAGNVLHRAGVPLGEFNRVESLAVAPLLDLLGVRMPDEAVSLLAEIQGRQDKGWTWGLAVDAARDARS